MDLRHILLLLTVLSAGAEPEAGNKTEDSGEYYYEYYEDVDYSGGIDVPETFQTYLEKALTKTPTNLSSTDNLQAKADAGAHTKVEAHQKHRHKHDHPGSKHLKHKHSRSHNTSRIDLDHSYVENKKNDDKLNQTYSYAQSFNDIKSEMEPFKERKLEKESKPKNEIIIGEHNNEERNDEISKAQRPTNEDDLVLNTNTLSKFLSDIGSRAKQIFMVKQPFFDFQGLLGSDASYTGAAAVNDEKELLQTYVTTKPKDILIGRSKGGYRKPLAKVVLKPEHSETVKQLIEEQPFLSKYIGSDGEIKIPKILDETLIQFKNVTEKPTISMPLYDSNTKETATVSSAADKKLVNTTYTNDIFKEVEPDLQDGGNDSSISIDTLINPTEKELENSSDQNVTSEGYKTDKASGNNETTALEYEAINSTVQDSFIPSFEKVNASSNITHSGVNSIFNDSFSHPLEELIANLAHEVSTKFVKKRKIKRPGQKTDNEDNTVETAIKDIDDVVENETNTETFIKVNESLPDINRGFINESVVNLTSTEFDSAGKPVRTVKRRRKIRKPKITDNLQQKEKEILEEITETNIGDNSLNNETIIDDTLDNDDYKNDTLDNRVKLERDQVNESIENANSTAISDEVTTANLTDYLPDVIESINENENEPNISQNDKLNEVNNATLFGPNTKEENVTINSTFAENTINLDLVDQPQEHTSEDNTNSEDVEVSQEKNDTVHQSLNIESNENLDSDNILNSTGLEETDVSNNGSILSQADDQRLPEETMNLTVSHDDKSVSDKTDDLTQEESTTENNELLNETDSVINDSTTDNLDSNTKDENISQHSTAERSEDADENGGGIDEVIINSSTDTSNTNTNNNDRIVTESDEVKDEKSLDNPNKVIQVIFNYNPPCTVGNSLDNDASLENDYVNEPNIDDTQYESKPCKDEDALKHHVNQNKQTRICEIRLSNGVIKKIVCPLNKRKAKHDNGVAPPYETIQIFENVVKRKTITKHTG